MPGEAPAPQQAPAITSTEASVKSEGRSRPRNRHKGRKSRGDNSSRKQDPVVPANLGTTMLSLALKRLIDADDMLMSIDTLTQFVRDDYLQTVSDGNNPNKVVVEGTDAFSDSSESPSPERRFTSDAGSKLKDELIIENLDDESTAQEEHIADDEETFDSEEKKPLNTEPKPVLKNVQKERTLDVRFFLDKVHLRRVMANCILPVTLNPDADVSEYYEVDVVEDKRRKNYPWIAQVSKAAPDSMQALSVLPDFVKLATPKKITPQMLNPKDYEGFSLADKAEELNRLLEKRREAVRNRRNEAEAKIQRTRKEAIMERMRVHDQQPTPPLFLSQEFISALSRSTGALLKILQQPTGFLENRYTFLEGIQMIINEAFPNSGVKAHLFGSSVTGLGTSRSDVDVTLEVPGTGNPEDHPCSNMYNLSKILRNAGMQKVIAVAHARVPICKFFDPKFRLSCDINVGNMLGIANSRLISTYLKLEPRLHPLIMVVKHWARSREINNPSAGGTISSYAYALMVINFLQVRGILPSLQKLYDSSPRVFLTTRSQERPKTKKRHRNKDLEKAGDPASSNQSLASKTAEAEPENGADEVETSSIQASSSESIPGMVTWDISFIDNLEDPKLNGYPKAMAGSLETSVATLFYGFLRYYGWDYLYRHDRVVSIREGKVLEHLPAPLVREKVPDIALVVEDPFQVPPVLNEFRRAARLLSDSCAQFTDDQNHSDIERAWRTIFEKSAPRIRKDSDDIRTSRRGASRGSREINAAGVGQPQKQRSLSRNRAGKLSMPTLPLNPPPVTPSQAAKSADNVRSTTPVEPKAKGPGKAGRNSQSSGNIPTAASSSTSSSKQSLRRQRSDKSLERSRSQVGTPSYQQLTAIQEVGVPLSPKTQRRPSVPANPEGEEFTVSTQSSSSSLTGDISSRHAKSTPNLKNQFTSDGKRISGSKSKLRQTSSKDISNESDESTNHLRTRDAWGNAPVPIRRLSQDASAPIPVRRLSQDAAAGLGERKPGYGKRKGKNDLKENSSEEVPGQQQVRGGKVGKFVEPQPSPPSAGPHPADALKDFVTPKVRLPPNQQNRGGNL
ncbi:hypothetical protein HDU67_002662 [Dinochytrium kinnereticum]|nr:hypothetical protein HDU67_002662 [Dinochytrium kinnereticum]